MVSWEAARPVPLWYRRSLPQIPTTGGAPHAATHAGHRERLLEGNSEGVRSDLGGVRGGFGPVAQGKPDVASKDDAIELRKKNTKAETSGLPHVELVET